MNETRNLDVVVGMNWKLDDLPLFVAVVDQKGVSAAANHLGLSKSCVSKAITRLETALGIRLLERNSRNVRLTDSGRSFYEKGCNIMELVNEADTTVSGLTAHPNGKLIAAMPIAFTREIVAPRIGEFQRQYPDIELELIVTSLPVDIIRDHIDIAVTIGTPNHSELIMRKLIDSHLCCVASPEYAQTHNLNTSLEELREHILFCETRYATNRFPVRLNGQNKHIDLKSDVVKVNDPITVRDAVMSGRGVAILPSQYCKKQLAAGTLIQVFNGIEFYMNKSVVSAIYPSRRMLPSKTRVFLDFLIKICAEI